MGRGVDDSRVRKFSMKEAAGTGGRTEPRWTAARGKAGQADFEEIWLQN